MDIVSPTTALAIVDSGSSRHAFVAETLRPALRFWGVPIEILDLADGKPPAIDPRRVAVVLLLQEGLTAAQLDRVAAPIAAAIRAGAGLVNCDPAVSVGAGPEGVTLAATGWSGVRPVRRFALAEQAHFVTAMQRAYRRFEARKPVPAVPRAADAGAPLLLAEGGAVLLACRTEPARIVDWGVSNWVWSQDFHGFARGVDALLWRGILWAARKPFAIAAQPPFGRFRFDDCRGLWRNPEDFSFADEMARVGEVPNLGVCLSAVTASGWRFLAERARRGELEVVPHVRAPEDGIFNVTAPAPSGGTDPLAEEAARTFDRHDCPMAKSVSDHNHEITPRGVAIARALGLTSRMNVMRVGERWEGLHRRWHPAPFGTMHFALDRFVDAPELFTAINHHASFSDSFLSLGDVRFLCTDFGGFTEDRWDFLNGHVRGPDDKDLGKALERLLVHTELCLTSLFFCGSISHTHFLCHLRPEEWRELLRAYHAFARPFGYRPAPYDRIAADAARRTGPGRLHLDPSSRAEEGAALPALVVRESDGTTVAAWDGVARAET